MDIENKMIDDFKKAISEYFYDKTIEIFRRTPNLDNEGTIEGYSETLIEQIQCNFQMINSEMSIKEFGNSIISNAMITCEQSISKIGDIAKYDNKKYVIVGITLRDTHTKIGLKIEGEQEI